MTQWIAIALILALCLLWIIRRINRRRKSGTPCCNCSDPTCPHRKNREHRH